MKGYFILFKDIDDYGYCLREYESSKEVIQWLDDNCGYDEVKVILGDTLQVVTKHTLLEQP